MTRQSICLLAAVWAAIALGAIRGDAAVEIVHEFTGGSGGANPQAPLLVSGGALFGTTFEGGASDAGTVFRVEPSGVGFATLHEFDAPFAPQGEGSFPSSGLTEVGGWLYGTTELGGASFDGVVYRITTAGSNYEPIHAFDASTQPAASPSGGVIADSGSLFGSTLFGSAVSEGAIYTVNPDGSGFAVLHELASDGSEGEEIAGPLALEGGSLWGIASFGGDHDGGTLFQYDLQADTLTVRHDFGDAGDGLAPVGGLTVHDGAFYGVTEQGGAFGNGTVFRIGVDGTGYQTIHDFAGGAADGTAPVGGLTLVGTELFGVTREAGPSDLGVVYSVDPATGNEFELHHAFSGADGAVPLSGLTYDGSALFGTTSAGGLGAGVVFSFDPLASRGDYNGDGVVDAADYTVWRDSEGSTTLLAADGDFSGVVDEADYAVWAAAFGQPALQTAKATPEPGAALLVVILCGVCRLPRRSGLAS